MKLLIISHTQHYFNSKNELVGWGPTVTELNYLLELFDEIYHIAVLCEDKAPESAIAYKSAKIQFIPIKKVGGKALKDKLNILIQLPDVLKKIANTLPKVDCFLLRTPTGMGAYLIPYLTLFSKTKGWFKYAGNWKETNIPISFSFQRWMLKKQSRSVTVNGKWPQERINILSFENPCLNEEDRIEGELTIKKKELVGKFDYCFVGNLDTNKGIIDLIQVFKLLQHENLGTLHIVGDGSLRILLEEYAKEILNPVIFHGFLSKKNVVEIYKKSHFIILPSKSEGFPKVIGEAMNFGCIPIVSEVSCINQYIQNNNNGFLINPITIEKIKNEIFNSLEMNNERYIEFIKKNYKISEKFTYSHYVNRIRNKIL